LGIDSSRPKLRSSNPVPIEKRETTTDFDTFISALSDTSIGPDRNEMMTLQGRGLQERVDARFFGQTHSTVNHIPVLQYASRARTHPRHNLDRHFLRMESSSDA
jgi:hypothetical protein